MSGCGDCHGCGTGTILEIPVRTARPKTIALIGPPNSGKTTLFNRLTGLRQKVANFPGVTVEQHTGTAELPDGHSLQLIDLPGDDARRLMELGFLPGARVTAGLSAPGGDPRVFQVDGSEIALRRETARHLTVRVEKTKRRQ